MGHALGWAPRRAEKPQDAQARHDAQAAARGDVTRACSGQGTRRARTAGDGHVAASGARSLGRGCGRVRDVRASLADAARLFGRGRRPPSPRAPCLRSGSAWSLMTSTGDCSSARWRWPDEWVDSALVHGELRSTPRPCSALVESRTRSTCTDMLRVTWCAAWQDAWASRRMKLRVEPASHC